MNTYDRLIPEFMHKHDLPGGAIAVVKDGRLVFAKGYGLADIQNQEPVQPDSLFRIASLSKQVTAVAVLKLVEDGKLDLDAGAFEILSDIREPEGSTRDPRLDQITVRHLLHHAGGWDKNESYDPMWSVWRTEEGTGAHPPITCSDVIHFMLGQPLDFAPGTRYAYANFGYCVLGRVIEAVSGQEYEEFVREHVLKPIGIARMRVGGTRLEERLDDEVRYYLRHGQDPAWSVFPKGPSRVPWPYGGFYLKGQDAQGGWVGSAMDLVRFATALDGSKHPTVLEPETVDLMLSRPQPQLQDTPYYYALGWLVRPVGDAKTWWHFGNQPGTTALIVRAHHGLTWVALFNLQPHNRQEAHSELNQLLWRATREVTTWPSHDLFPQFGYE
jgi:N-acyl-D-amino-acid deacylase